jgi:hypothetical protein
MADSLMNLNQAMALAIATLNAWPGEPAGIRWNNSIGYMPQDSVTTPAVAGRTATYQRMIYARGFGAATGATLIGIDATTGLSTWKLTGTTVHLIQQSAIDGACAAIPNNCPVYGNSSKATDISKVCGDGNSPASLPLGGTILNASTASWFVVTAIPVRVVGGTTYWSAFRAGYTSTLTIANILAVCGITTESVISGCDDTAMTIIV